MKRRKIVFFGDSNTYGYEPSEVLPGRYPEEIRWTARLAKALGEGWDVIPEGLNGRKLPDLSRPDQQELVLRILEKCGKEGILGMMLGTNDLLWMGKPDAAPAVEKMDAFLDFVTKRKKAEEVWIIGPPYIGLKEAEEGTFFRACFEENKAMNEGFRRACSRYGARFVNAGEWGISLSYDLVHFSPEGNRQFAEHMEEELGHDDQRSESGQPAGAGKMDESSSV